MSHGQLIELGLSRRAIQHRMATGKLHPLFRGIYAVGRPELTRHGRWMAAILAGGAGAVLSHRSAAALWGMASSGSGSIEIAVPVASVRRCPGVRAYRRASLGPSDLAERDRIPVITPVLTLVELAGTGYPQLERAVNEADRLGLIDPENLRGALEAYRGRRGTRRLRELLDRQTFRLTDSELERLFMPLAAQAGLSVPLTRQYLNGFRVDFFWPKLRLVVETDGLRYHRAPAQQARDRLRDQTHLAAGFTPLRFTHAQVRYEPENVCSTLGRVARHLAVA